MFSWSRTDTIEGPKMKKEKCDVFRVSQYESPCKLCVQSKSTSLLFSPFTKVSLHMQLLLGNSEVSLS